MRSPQPQAQSTHSPEDIFRSNRPIITTRVIYRRISFSTSVGPILLTVLLRIRPFLPIFKTKYFPQCGVCENQIAKEWCVYVRTQYVFVRRLYVGRHCTIMYCMLHHCCRHYMCELTAPERVEDVNQSRMGMSETSQLLLVAERHSWLRNLLAQLTFYKKAGGCLV